MSASGRERHDLQVAEGSAALLRWGTGGPCLFWGIAPGVHTDDEVERVFAKSRVLVGDRPFSVVAYRRGEWDAAFSPWQADVRSFTEPSHERHFAGEGPQTLEWLVEEVLEAACERMAARPSANILVGYSLAGLFSVWGLCNPAARGTFLGAASCSGSFWFPGWESCLAGARFPKGSIVYQSLGRKEERVVDPLIARVGSSNRALAARIEADPQVRAWAFEHNDGGHFHDTPGRVARAIAWVVCNTGTLTSEG